jgi:hypothetical protein
LEHTTDGVNAQWYERSNRLARFEIIPYLHRAALVRAQPPAFPTAEGAAPAAQVEARGEFYFLTKDGRMLTGPAAGTVPLEDGTQVATGRDGHVRLVLPDNTTFTVGPNSKVAIDTFVYDPANASATIAARVDQGLFRFVTGKGPARTPRP